MDFTLLFNSPLFWPAIGSFVLFTCLAIYVLRNPPAANRYDKVINPAIYASIFFVLALGNLWSAQGDSILWSLQPHDDLLTTNGQIIHSTTVYQSGKFASWHYQIRFQYKIDDKFYESDRVRYGSSTSKDGSVAADYVDKYPMGKPVVVYYDPLDPQKAVLEPGVKDYYGLLFIVMLVSIEIFFVARGIAIKSA